MSIKKYLAAMLIVFTCSVANAADETVPGDANGTFLGAEISNIGSIELGKNLEISAVRSGPYLLNDDPVPNIFGKVFGTDSFMPFVKDLGFAKEIQRDPFFETYFIFSLILSGALALGSVGYLITMVFKLQSEDVRGVFESAIAKKAWLLIALFVLINVAAYLAANAVLAITAMVNWTGLSFSLQSTDLKNTASLDDTSLQKNYYAVGGMVKIDQAVFRNTRQALIAFNFANMADAGLVGSYSKKEVADRILESAEADVTPNGLGDVNVDVTSSWRNMVNFYATANNYDVKFNAPSLKLWERKTWGYKHSFGVINFNNAVGLNFERSNGENMNDGTFISQLRDIQKNAAKSLGNETFNYISMIGNDEAFYELILNGSVDSTNVYQDPYLEIYSKKIIAQYKADAKNLVKQYYKPDEIGVKDTSNLLAASSSVYKAAYSGYLGADMNMLGNGGDIISKVMKHAVRQITLAKLNELCTVAWDDNKAVRASVDAYNAIPADTAFRDIVKGVNGMQAAFASQCVYLDDDRTFKNLGSEHIEDALYYRTKQMQWFFATTYVYNKIQEAMRAAILEDQSAASQFASEMVKNLRAGIIGAAANFSLVVKIQKQKKDAFTGISNTLFVQYNGPADKDNFVAEEIFTGTTDEKLNGEMHERSVTTYPEISYASLLASPIVNIQPSTDENESTLEALVSLSFQQMVDKLFGTDNTALKLMLRLPLNMAVSDGASFCRAEPARCSTNDRVSIPVGLMMMGGEFINDALTTFTIKTALGTILQLWDAGGGVDTDALSATEKSAAATVGDASRITTFTKVLGGIGAKIAHAILIALYIVASAQMSIAWFKLAVGFVLVVVLPSYFVVMIMIRMIKQLMNIVFIVAKLIIATSLTMLESEPNKVFAPIKDIALEFVFELISVGVFALFMFVSIVLLLNLDLDSTMLMIISLTAGKGLIANVVMTVMIMVIFCVVAYMLMRFADEKTDEIAQLFKVKAAVDKDIEFLMIRLRDPQLMNAAQQLHGLSEKELSQIVKQATSKHARAERDERTEKRKQLVQAARKHFRSEPSE